MTSSARPTWIADALKAHDEREPEPMPDFESTPVHETATRETNTETGNEAISLLHWRDGLADDDTSETR